MRIHWALAGGALLVTVLLLQQTYAELLGARHGSPRVVGEAASPALAATPVEQRGRRRTEVNGFQQRATDEKVELTSKDVEQRRKESVLRRARMFNEAFEREAVDLEWSKQYEQAITKRFTEQSTNSLESLRCRSTMCRAVVRHATAAARADLAEILGPEPLSGGSFFHPLEDGSLASVAYMGRPGLKFEIAKAQTKENEVTR